MAQLPHRIDIRAGTDRLREIQSWCHEQWPHTHQATWYGRMNPAWGSLLGEGNWWFQREEDALMFRLAWCRE